MQEIMQELLKFGFELKVPTGKVIFEEGEPAQTMYYIKQGEIHLESEIGHVLADLSDGEHFGGLSMVVRQHTRSSRAVATKESELILIDRAIYDKLAVSNPELIIDLLEQITNTLYDSEQKLIDKNQKLAGENQKLSQTYEHLVISNHPDTTEKARRFQIKDYILTKEIGKGGYAEVYLGKSVKTGKEFAIKVYDTKCENREENRIHFETEVKVLEGLDHQNICTVLDTGENEHCVYIVAKAYLGGSLYERIAHKRLTQKRIFFFFKMVLNSLEYLHINGIIYKDLKAQNILSDENDILVLSDFGSSNVHKKRLTSQNDGKMVMLSPYYMSPEQTRNEKLNYLTDYYSLGILLFEMITGHKPFIEKSIGAFIKAHQEKEIPRLPEKRIAYQKLLDGLVAKNKYDRFQNIKQIKTELMNVARNIGITRKEPPKKLIV